MHNLLQKVVRAGLLFASGVPVAKPLFWLDYFWMVMVCCWLLRSPTAAKSTVLLNVGWASSV
jgi:hypothetical protein